jgi:putative phosphoesterase
LFHAGKTMKLAVLSDIHSNLVALQAVTYHIESWGADVVVVAGDLVNRGPRPAECLRFVQEKQHSCGWQVILGNHEEYVIKHAKSGEPRSGPQFDVRRVSYWTYKQLGDDVSALEAMAFSHSLHAPDSGEVRLTHASMRSTRDGIYTNTTDEELRQQMGAPPPALFCVGHTHMPLVRRTKSTLVVNAGAAGLPFDGDVRASYAQLTWHSNRWEAAIVRVGYDVEQAERDFADSGFLEQGGPLAQLVLTELHTARSQLYQWAARYEGPVLAGKLTMEESVQQFIEHER